MKRVRSRMWKGEIEWESEGEKIEVEEKREGGRGG